MPDPAVLSVLSAVALAKVEALAKEGDLTGSRFESKGKLNK